MAVIALVASQWPSITRGGGIARPTENLARELSKQGFAVHVFLVNSGGRVEQVKSSVAYTIHFLAADRGRAKVTPRALSDAWCVAEALEALNPDVVVGQDWQGLLSIYARSAQRAPIISWLHGATLYILHGEGQYFQNQAEVRLAALEQVQIEESDAVVSPSKFLLDLYQGYHMSLPDNHLIRYWFPKEKWSGSTTHPGAPTLVFLGQLSKRKGLMRFVQAAQYAAAEMPELEVLIAGRSVDYSGKQIESSLKKSGVKCRFIGLVSVREAWNQICARNSVLVVTSDLDNSPNTVYESLSRGKKVVILGESNGARELRTLSPLVSTFSQQSEVNWASMFENPAGSAATGEFLRKSNQETTAQWVSLINELAKSHARRQVPEAEVVNAGINIGIVFDGDIKGLRNTLCSVRNQNLSPSKCVILPCASTISNLDAVLEESWGFPVEALEGGNGDSPSLMGMLRDFSAAGPLVLLASGADFVSKFQLKEAIIAVMQGTDLVSWPHAEITHKSSARVRKIVASLGSSIDPLLGPPQPGVANGIVCSKSLIEGFLRSEQIAKPETVTALLFDFASSNNLSLGASTQPLRFKDAGRNLRWESGDSSFVRQYEQDFFASKSSTAAFYTSALRILAGKQGAPRGLANFREKIKRTVRVRMPKFHRMLVGCRGVIRLFVR